MWKAIAPLGATPPSWGPGEAKEPGCCLMAKDCSVLAGEMEQSWETWGQDLFLPGPQTSPEPEVPSFQGLEVTGEILWCLLGAFAPGDPSKGTVPRDMSASFHQDLEG